MLSLAIFALLLCGQAKDDAPEVRSEHFHIYCADPKLAQEVSFESERHRREIIEQWAFGKSQNWPYPHIVRIHQDKAQHGSNRWIIISNVINVGGAHDEMIQGSLRHEIAHSVVLTTHGLKMPLWANEGIAMLCENHSGNNEKLIDFAGNDSLIELFEATQYPFLFEHRYYGKSLSVTTWLVEVKGRKKFVDFVIDGNVNGWKQAITKHLGFESMNDMQVAWANWHKDHYGKPLKERAPK